MTRRTICKLLIVCIIAAGAASGCAGLAPILTPNAATSEAPKTDFYTFDEIVAQITAWQREYGSRARDLAKIVEIGESWEGRPIYAVKISSDASKDDPEKPDILVTGGVHACEWIGVETTMYFAKRLLRDYDSDDYVRYIVDNSEIWIVPLVNPDGFVYSQEKPEHRLWRKNRRPVGNGQFGVDLNRAYPHKWRLPGDSPDLVGDDTAGSDDPSSRNYRGEADPNDPNRPGKVEKEIQALIRLTENPGRNFALYLDYHSFSEKILYPRGYTRERLQKDFDTYEFLAGGMANLINRRRGLLALAGSLSGVSTPGLYEFSQAGLLYLESVTGSSIDYYYDVRGIMSIGVELSPAFTVRRYTYGTGYILGADRIIPVASENFSSFLFAADWAIGPGCVNEMVIEQDGQEVFRMAQAYGREAQVEHDSGRLKPGEAVVKLVFNKPMLLPGDRRMVSGDEAGVSNLKLLDTLGRLHRPAEAGGWRKTRYENDTFVGAVTIKDDADFDFSRGAVIFRASDGIGFAPDLRPATRPVYVAGEGLWLNYERDHYERAPVNRAELIGAGKSRE